MANTDIRTTDNTLRAKDSNDSHVISGTAIVFNQRSQWLGFYEEIRPQAVRNINFDDTLLLYNHEYGNVLARVNAHNLDISVDDKGVYFRAVLPDTTLANDVYNDIQARNIQGCSFGFNIAKDHWTVTEDNEPLHIIDEIDSITELSVTPIPAYSQTSAQVSRSLEDFRKSKEAKDMADKDKELEKVQEPLKEQEQPKEEPKKVEEPKQEPKLDIAKLVHDEIAKLVEEHKQKEESKKDDEERSCDDKKKDEKRSEEPKEKPEKEQVIESVDKAEDEKKDLVEEDNSDEQKSEQKGASDMAQVIKKAHDEKSEEKRNLEAWIKGNKRDMTQGFKETPDGSAVIPQQILDMAKVPNDPTQLSSYVNRVTVEAPSGRIPVLAKATATLATADELAENPSIANATISKVDYALETMRGQLPVSMEMVQDYHDITGILSDYINQVKKNTEQKQIGTILQTAEAVSASSLDDIKKAFNSLINYGDDRKFVVTVSMFNALDTMKDNEGRYLLKDDVTAATGKTLLGAEIIIVPDTILGNAGDLKMFVGSLKAFATVAIKGEVTLNWTENRYFEQVLGCAIREDVVAVDKQAGKFITYTAPKAASAGSAK